MRKPIVMMFPGQGAQYYLMGKQLYEAHPGFRSWMTRCDSITQNQLGLSISDVIYDEKSKGKTFDRLLYTNPALVAVEYSLARTLMDMGIKPDLLLGYSLGEVTTCIMSGALTLEQGLKFSIDAAKLIESQSPPGGMLAVIGKESLMQQHSTAFSGCWLAGRNFSSNFVVGGLDADIRSLKSYLNGMDVVSQRLPVNYAFHSPLLDPLKNAFSEIMPSFDASQQTGAVFSATKVDWVTKPDTDHLWEAIRNPVHFSASINHVANIGASVFIDVGPSATLATFVKYILAPGSQSSYLETINPFGRNLESLEKLTAALDGGSVSTPIPV